MAIFPDVYVSMIMISSMGIISMSISYCPYALLGQYFEIKEVCLDARVCVEALLSRGAAPSTFHRDVQSVTDDSAVIDRWSAVFPPQYINHSPANTKRGFGIDCAILSCQVSLFSFPQIFKYPRNLFQP